jgi:hypothetical protein
MQEELLFISLLGDVITNFYCKSLRDEIQAIADSNGHLCQNTIHSVIFTLTI